MPRNRSTAVDADAQELLKVTDNSFAGINQMVSSFDNMSKQNAQQEIQRERAQAVEKLKSEVIALSVAAAEKIVSKKIDADCEKRSAFSVVR